MTLLWYDIETFGLHSRYDRIAQFAALRTDEAFNPLEDPIVLYGKLSPDYLPDPLACLKTGITPQQVNKCGLFEAELIREIDSHFSRPGTCVLGFNNIAFDDEFIRNLYYRNFYDPYRREWAEGNSRWDILNVVRAARDFRPEGINWPFNEEGRPSVKLELMSGANNLAHTHAHDALSDVQATIALAKLIHDKQPKLFEWAWQHRTKNQIRPLIDLDNRTPLAHTSSIHYTRYGYSTLVCPLVTDPHIQNTIYVFDLRYDPEPLLSLPVEEIRKRLHTSIEELSAEGLTPIPLKAMAINKSPFLAPRAVFSDKVAARLGIDLAQVDEHWKKLKKAPQITAKLRQVFGNTPEWGSIDDPDMQIYDRFFPDEDKGILEIIRNAQPAKLPGMNINCKDSRIPEMLRRYIGRNYPQYLDEESKHRWKSFCASRILFPPIPAASDLGKYKKRIAAWMSNDTLEAEKKPILKALKEYGADLEQELLAPEND